MADPILIPIPDLAPAPSNWGLDWPTAIADPVTKRAYKLASGAYTQKLIESGAIADIRNPKFYICGRGNQYDPVAGDTSITDPTLEGYTFSAVSIRGIGDLDPASEYLWDQVDTISFLSLDPENPGARQFNDGDVVKVTFEPKISSYVSAPGSIGKRYSGRKRYPASAMILPDDYSKIQEIVATATPVALTLPKGSDYPSGVGLTITTNMVSIYQSVILTQDDDVIFITAVGKSQIVLGVDEQVTLVWIDDGTIKGWSVEHISESYKNVGKWCLSYIPLPNTVPFIGGLIDITQNPRAADLVEAIRAIDSNSVVSNATWESDPFRHRTKWAYGPTENTRRVPDWRGLFPRVLPGSRTNIDQDRGVNATVLGSYESSAMPIHDHVTNPNFNKLSAKASDLGGGSTPVIDAVGGEKEYRVGDMTGPGYELWSLATIKAEGDSQYENRSVNGGLNAYGCI